MKTKIKIKTVTGLTMEFTGYNYRLENGIHYLDAASYPDSIVEKVEVVND